MDWFEVYEKFCLLIQAFFLGSMIVVFSDKTLFPKRVPNLLIGMLSIEAAGFLRGFLPKAWGFYGRNLFGLNISLLFFIIAVFIINRDKLINKLKIIGLAILITFLSVWVPLYYFSQSAIIFTDYHGGFQVQAVFLRMLSMTWSISLCTAVIFIKVRFNIKRLYLPLFFLLAVPLLQLIYIHIIFNPETRRDTIPAVITSTLALVVTAALNIIFLNYTERIHIFHRKEKEAEVFSNMKEMEFQYYELVQSEIDRTSKIRHDIGNQLEQIEYLVANGDSNKDGPAFEMLKELKKKTSDFTKLEYCDNPIINTILTIKSKYARDNGVAFDARVNIVSDIPVSPLDLSSIVSNLLDNAIKSAINSKHSSEQALVRVKIDETDDMIYFRVENTTTIVEHLVGAEEFFNQRETKSRNHGYGLKILDDITRRNNGEFFIENKDMVCTVILTIKKG